MSEKWISRIIGDPLGPFFVKGTKNNIFSVDFYKRNYGVLLEIYNSLKILCQPKLEKCWVIPIVMLAISDVCWVTYCTVKCFFRTNIVVTHWNRPDRDKLELLIDPQNRKFATYNQTFPIQQDLFNIYQDMKCVEDKRLARRLCRKLR